MLESQASIPVGHGRMPMRPSMAGATPLEPWVRLSKPPPSLLLTWCVSFFVECESSQMLFWVHVILLLKVSESIELSGSAFLSLFLSSLFGSVTQKFLFNFYCIE